MESGKHNFSEQEKLFLMQVIAEKGSVIENKNTDGVTLRQKREAWDEITTTYNSQNYSSKSTKQLKKCWDNIKQKKRKLNTEIRQHRLITGGGSPLQENNDPILEYVDAITPNMDIEIDNEYDSTAVFVKEGNMSNRQPLKLLQLPSTSVSQAQAMSSATQAIYSTPQAGSSKLQAESSTPSRRKVCKVRCNSSDEEKELKILKIKESIEQQRMLFEKRMETAEAENKLAILKLLAYERQIQNS